MASRPHRLACSLIAVGAASALSGCGISHPGSSPAPAAPTPNAKRIYRRAEHALARTRSATITTTDKLTRHKWATVRLRIHGPGAVQLDETFPTFAIQMRLVKQSTYIDTSLRGPLALLTQYTGRQANSGWIKSSIPAELAHTESLSNPHKLASCLLRPHPARISFVRAVTYSGLPADLLSIRQGRHAKGRLLLWVSAAAPYVPLQMSLHRAGPAAENDFSGWIGKACHAIGGQVTSQVAQLKAKEIAAGIKVPLVKSVTIVFGAYDTPARIAVPKHARSGSSSSEGLS